jgi:hypothetical protein
MGNRNIRSSSRLLARGSVVLIVYETAMLGRGRSDRCSIDPLQRVVGHLSGQLAESVEAKRLQSYSFFPMP